MRLTPRHALAAVIVVAVAAGAVAFVDAASDSSSISARQVAVRELSAVIPTRLLGLDEGRVLTTGCTLPEQRQFDFWVGTWHVHDTAGTLAGVNVIELELDGCVVEENWSDGQRGRSINTYDGADRQWHQHWAFSAGGPTSVLLLDGASPRRGEMRMGGTRPRPDSGQVEDAITWTAITRDSLRQLWRVSVNDRAPVTLFDGYYRRVDQPTSIPINPSRACLDRPASRAMDFLLGEWTIAADSGDRRDGRHAAPTVTFTADLDHCLIEERIDGPGPYRAWSFSGYHPVSAKWARTWVDNLGQRLLLTGNADGDRMVLSGTKTLASGDSLLVRMTYAPAGSDRVTQRWESSRDGGAAWATDLEVRLVRVSR